MVAARNVTRVTDAAQPHYTFEISGPALADYLRRQLEEQLRAAGELPPGISLSTPEQFRYTAGEGEVWLGAENFPARLRVHLEYPQEANGERVEVEMTTDFAGFDRQMAAAQTPADKIRAALLTAKSKAAAPDTPLAFSLVGLLSLTVLNSRSKHLYAALVVVVIFSMLATPLLQGAQVHAFARKQAEKETIQQQNAEAEQAAQASRAGLYANHWDPHREPGTEQAGSGALANRGAAPNAGGCRRGRAARPRRGRQRPE